MLDSIKRLTFCESTTVCLRFQEESITQFADRLSRELKGNNKCNHIL